MAIFHLHAQMIKRSTGRSSVAAAAYRAGEKLHNDYDGITHDYSRKTGVVHKQIILPKGAPKEYTDRSTLWNAVEQAEKRKDAQTAREIDIALPAEFNRREQLGLVREYIKDNFVSAGMCADLTIHDIGNGNPHAHIMLTTREVSANGFGPKNRDWNGRALLEQWRENWAVKCNDRLKEKGIDKRIDHRTLKKQGIKREPTIHIGATAQAMEKAGRTSDRMRVYKEIVSQNKVFAQNRTSTPQITAEYMHELKQGYIILDKEITGKKQNSAEIQREIKALKHNAERMGERAESISVLGRRIAELKEQRQGMGVFTNKKFIDADIQRFENSLLQANASFKRDFSVSPLEAIAEAAKLVLTAKNLQRGQELSQKSIEPLIAERKDFMLEYQRQKLLADINPNSQRIHDEFSRLDNDSARRQSVRGSLTQVRSEREIDVVTEDNFQEILKGLQPEHAKTLIKQREQEKKRERERSRGR